MTAICLDITIEQGADYGTPFAVPAITDPAGQIALMQLKVAADYPTAILTLSSLDGSLIIDAGAITPVIPASVTATIGKGRYVYDLKLISASGVTTRAYQGRARVSEQVTTITALALAGLLLESGGSLLLETGGTLTFESGLAPSLFGLLLESGLTLALENGGSFLMDARAPLQPFLLETGGLMLLENGNQLSLEA